MYESPKIKDVKKCRKCGHPIAFFNEEWWHVSTYGEYGEPSISLRKRESLSVEPKICDCCGEKRDIWTVCVTPEP